MRAHLRRLVASGLVLGHLADEAGVPRSTAYAIWRGTRRTNREAAAALLALRPLRVADALPERVRERDALADALRSESATATRSPSWICPAPGSNGSAAQLGVTPRTVTRWRAAQADGPDWRSA